MSDAACAVSVIIPANDEADYIDACLSALWASDQVERGAQAIVVANGCSDDTAERARGHAATARRTGWTLRVLDRPAMGKPAALNAGDAAASGKIRVYLDADVVVSAPLVAQIGRVLNVAAPRFASGKPIVAAAQSRITQHYARFWQRLPFVAEGVPGFGVYAVNVAGRRRWQEFPDVIADDTFVRLSFTPEERLFVSAPYTWPLIEGFASLVRVRRRQNAGVTEIAQRFPDYPRRDDKRRLGLRGLLGLALHDPLGFAVYGTVTIAVRAGRDMGEGWARGR